MYSVSESYRTEGGRGMSEKIRVLISEEEVETRIQQIAAKISKDYAGKEIHLICVLKGE